MENSKEMGAGYSRIKDSFKGYKKRADEKRMLRPVSAFSAEECTPEAVEERIKLSLADFWHFDKIYFSPSQYQKYAEPSEYHHKIYEGIVRPGATVHAGPRDGAKSSFAKKIYIWLLLKGQYHVLGLASFILTTAQNMTSDIAKLISNNARIMHDFKVEFTEQNTDQFCFRVLSDHVDSHEPRYGYAFSEGRSIRGYSREFFRPEIIWCDDLENSKSPIGGEHTTRRIAMLEEMYGSLGGENPSMWCSGNNFHHDGYIARLLDEQEKGLMGDKSDWVIEIHRAWENGKSFWYARFPANSLEEMIVMVRARTKQNFEANWQQNPTPPQGHIFLAQFQKFWTSYPKDCKGIIYTDQNLALKGLGDTTAIVRMTYSPNEDSYYISARCRSYADPDILLDDTLKMKNNRIRGIGFDGNVSQTAHWKMHVRSWCRKNKAPFPAIRFCRYTVDELATNFQMVYAEGRVYFDPALSGSEEGMRFFAQFFAFVSKKEKRKDDAPDACICAYQFLTERNLNRKGGADAHSTTSVNEDD